jgi:hypothetical protein
MSALLFERPALSNGCFSCVQEPLFSFSQTQREIVSQILAANPECADCGQKSPDWASINMGVVVCIECSGIHRSLGVHVSKVRSLTLDRLDFEVLQLLLVLGNERINAVWEAMAMGRNPDENAPLEPKPEPTSPRDIKELWIRRKYIQRDFVDPFALPGVTFKSELQDLDIVDVSFFFFLFFLFFLFSSFLLF